MKSRLLLVVLLLSCVPAVVSAGTIAGPITNAANGHYYYLLGNDNWTNSEAEAVSLGGHLATIRDEAENQWVLTNFSEFGGVSRLLWIGLNDREAEGVFGWTSGEQVTYLNWNDGEPSNNAVGEGEDAVHLFPLSSASPGRWNDLAAWWTVYGDPTHGVVEIDPTPKLIIEVASVAIRWHSLTNSVYQVQYLSSLTSNNWTDLGIPIPGTGSNIVVLDSVLDEPRRFYRVQLLP